jgi:hypothetical protein
MRAPTCTFQITNHKGEWPRPCEQPVIAEGHCASHHALCNDAFQFVLSKIVSPSVKMYYVGLTSRPRARSHGAKNRAYNRIMLKQSLGPAEAIGLEKFLQENVNAVISRASYTKSTIQHYVIYLITLRSAHYRRRCQFTQFMWHAWISVHFTNSEDFNAKPTAHCRR